MNFTLKLCILEDNNWYFHILAKINYKYIKSVVE